jgi:hypothetical protein
MSLEAERFKGHDAKALLDNPLLKEAFFRVEMYLKGNAMACDPDDKDKAARIITSMQLLKGIRREIERMIEDGDIANVQISELETRKVARFYR